MDFFEILKTYEINYDQEPPEHVKKDLRMFLKLYNLYPDLGIIEFTYLILKGQFEVNETNGKIIVYNLDKYELKGIKIEDSHLVKINYKNVKSPSETENSTPFEINSKSLYNIICSCKDTCEGFVNDYIDETTKKAIDYLYLPEVIRKIQYIHKIFTYDNETESNDDKDIINDIENNIESFKQFEYERLCEYRTSLIELIQYFNDYDFNNHTLFKEFVEKTKKVLCSF
jgi:hypothetical protein